MIIQDNPLSHPGNMRTRNVIDATGRVSAQIYAACMGSHLVVCKMALSKEGDLKVSDVYRRQEEASSHWKFHRRYAQKHTSAAWISTLAVILID